MTATTVPFIFFVSMHQAIDGKDHPRNDLNSVERGIVKLDPLNTLSVCVYVQHRDERRRGQDLADYRPLPQSASSHSSSKGHLMFTHFFNF